MNAQYDADGMIVAAINGETLTVPDVSDNRHRQMIAAWEAEGNIIAPYVAPVPQPPTSITPLQARNELRAWGVGRDQMAAYFAAIEDDTERGAAEDAWEYAIQIDRDDPLIESVARFLNRTKDEVDQFFTEAAGRG